MAWALDDTCPRCRTYLHGYTDCPNPACNMPEKVILRIRQEQAEFVRQERVRGEEMVYHEEEERTRDRNHLIVSWTIILLIIAVILLVIIMYPEESSNRIWEFFFGK